MALPHFDERGRGLDHAITFSDGVFPIAITLLVLSFRVPTFLPATSMRTSSTPTDESGILIGFALSFYVVARFWMTHHRLSVLLRYVDSTFIALNLVFLAFIVFLPFPTEVLGVYDGATTAVVFDALAMTITGLLSTAVWQYALTHRLMDDRVTAAWRRGG